MRRRVELFNPDQPRDEHGRWIGGGAGGTLGRGGVRILRQGGHAYADRNHTGPTQRYTAVAKFPDGGREEIDVDARDRGHARAIARAAVWHDYKYGGQITRIIGPRSGLYR